MLVGDQLVKELEVLGEVAGADIKHGDYLPSNLSHDRGLMINRLLPLRDIRRISCSTNFNMSFLFKK